MCVYTMGGKWGGGTATRLARDDSLATSARTRVVRSSPYSRRVIVLSLARSFLLHRRPARAHTHTPAGPAQVGRPRPPPVLPTHLRRFFAGYAVPVPDSRPVFSPTAHVPRTGVRPSGVRRPGPSPLAGSRPFVRHIADARRGGLSPGRDGGVFFPSPPRHVLVLLLATRTRTPEAAVLRFSATSRL